MSKLKFLFVALIMAFSVAAKAQITTDSKGFTVQVYIGMYQENGESKSYDVNDIYNISLTDKYLVHNVLDGDGVVTDSQLYKLSNIKVDMVDGMPTFWVDATSGLSGNTYKYEFTFIESVASVTRTQPSGSEESFIGITVLFKTYQQN